MVPKGLYSRWKKYYSRDIQPVIPSISTGTAIAFLIVYTLIYVVPFYLSATTRPASALSRDAPSVIRGRIRSVTICCIVCSLVTLATLTSAGDSSIVQSLHLMGYFPISMGDIVKTLLLTATLFAGPLFEKGIVDGEWRDWIRLRGLQTVISSWIGWRVFVAGPITEEVLFRSASVPLLLLAQTSITNIIFLTPIIFGLAHIHHFYEFRITHPHTPIIVALLRSLFQLGYTTAFGGYATFIYLRTGNLVSVILLHSFCNWMGIPRFSGAVGDSDNWAESQVESVKRDGNYTVRNKRKRRLMLTTMYYALLVGGALGWWKLIWPMTKSHNALATL